MNPTPPLFLTGLRCIICGATYEHGNIFTCPICGEQGVLDVQYNYESISPHLTSSTLCQRSQTHWRYRELLPVSPDIALPHLHIGWTPIYEVQRLAQAVGIKKLFLKDDGRNPTNSF
ncbi:MAG: threonine synthase, partial [Bacteroidota bacterium]